MAMSMIVIQSSLMKKFKELKGAFPESDQINFQYKRYDLDQYLITLEGVPEENKKLIEDFVAFIRNNMQVALIFL